ncbi:MAG: hypothetical protein Q8K75_12190 [Chlamydiales bacterium]|nr:hypothetical protein [Chlamydiales bacterium]
MTRMSKQGERRHTSPRKHKRVAPAAKTGARQDKLEKGFKEHENAVAEKQAPTMFVPKVR